MTTPKVGMLVWYYQWRQDINRYVLRTGLISKVHSDRLVDLSTSDVYKTPPVRDVPNVPLVHKGDSLPEGDYCCYGMGEQVLNESDDLTKVARRGAG